jgi:protein-disulfide isomerase
MPSGKRARQQRRAAAVRTPPPVRSKGGGIRPRQASPRVLAIAGGAVALIAIAIVLAVVLSGGNKGSATPAVPVGDASAAFALPGAPAAETLFKGIPQNGLVLGKSSAPVEMEMFIDVQCPICQNYEINYLPTIVQKYIRTGKVQLHLEPWAFLGPQSFTGRLAVIAASFQNKGYEYAKVLYDNQRVENSGWLDDAMMTKIAESVTGLNISQWQAAKDGSRAKQIASAVDNLAKKTGTLGTPTVLVGPAGGKLRFVVPPRAAPNLQQTEQALDQAIRGA